MGGGREEVWDKIILNRLIGFDGLPNNTQLFKWVLLGNPFIPICKNCTYPYPYPFKYNQIFVLSSAITERVYLKYSRDKHLDEALT